MDKPREIRIDWLRVTACFLVMMTHGSEPFYLGGEGSLILTRTDALWGSVLNVLPRACVALFVFAWSLSADADKRFPKSGEGPSDKSKKHIQWKNLS